MNDMGELEFLRYIASIRYLAKRSINFLILDWDESLKAILISLLKPLLSFLGSYSLFEQLAFKKAPVKMLLG
jgi:hypothetical protein